MSLRMPEPKDVLDTIKSMLGRSSSLAAGGEPLNLKRPPQGTYLVPLCNEAGETVGGVVANIGATVYLGGTLIMLPENSLTEQVRARAAEEFVLDGFEEVVNMLRAVVTRAEGNPRVIPSPVRLLDVRGEDAWVREATERLDFSGIAASGPLQLSIVGL